MVHRSSTFSLLGFDQFARAAHRAQSNILFTRSLVILKGCNSGRARRKRYPGHDIGKGHTASMFSLSLPLSSNLHTFTNPEAL